MACVIELGNGERTPFAASADPIARLDPILTRLCDALKAHVPPMFGDLRNAMPSPLNTIIAQAIPYRPSTIQQTSGLSFPLLATWRERTNVSESNLNSIRMDSDLVIAYVAPPLSNDQQSLWAGIVERVAMLIASLLSVNATRLGNAILRTANESLAVERIEFGMFSDETGLELPTAMIRCSFSETWLFHGFTDDADPIVGIDYTIGSELKADLVETSQTFGD